MAGSAVAESISPGLKIFRKKISKNQTLDCCRKATIYLHSIYTVVGVVVGFPSGTSGKEPICQCRRHKRCRLDPWVRKISWRRAWQPTPVFLPEESPWTEEPGGAGLATVHSISKSWTLLK